MATTTIYQRFGSNWPQDLKDYYCPIERVRGSTHGRIKPALATFVRALQAHRARYRVSPTLRNSAANAFVKTLQDADQTPWDQFEWKPSGGTQAEKVFAQGMRAGFVEGWNLKMMEWHVNFPVNRYKSDRSEGFVWCEWDEIEMGEVEEEWKEYFENLVYDAEETSRVGFEVTHEA